MGIIYFNGKSCADYGIFVESFPDREWPEKVISAYTIPGRSGDVVIDEETYSNVDRSYNVAILVKPGSSFQASAAAVSKWLHSGHGYCRLEDSYEPEVYRMAYYKEGASLTSLLRQGGRVSLTFNCKPQRYLKDGEKAIAISSETTLMNLTDYPSRPLLRIHGDGDGLVVVGGTTITLTGITEYIDIDCDNQICYKDDLLIGNKVEFSTLDYPFLAPGDNVISFTGGVSSVIITPRWYII